MPDRDGTGPVTGTGRGLGPCGDEGDDKTEQEEEENG